MVPPSLGMAAGGSGHRGPEASCVWVVARAWRCGEYLVQRTRERQCGLAMCFMSRLRRVAPAAVGDDDLELAARLARQRGPAFDLDGRLGDPEVAQALLERLA